MYNNKRMVWYGVMILIGVTLVVLAGFEVLDNYWSGFGGGITAVGAIRLLLGRKYRQDESYAKMVDTTQKDERILYITQKAKSMTFFWKTMILAVASIVLKCVGMDDYSKFCGILVAFGVLLYLIIYSVLNKKY